MAPTTATAGERLGHAAPHVGAVVRLRCRDHKHDLVELRGERALGAARVRHQRDVGHVGIAADSRHHFRGVAELRNRLRRDERRRLDLGHTGLRKAVDDLDLALGGNPVRLDLESVACNDVVNEDALAHIVPAARNRAISSPL